MTHSRGWNSPGPAASRAGFSLLELILVVAVMGVLLGAGLVYFSNDGLVVTQNARVVSREMQLVRFDAINENESVGVRLDTSQGVVEAYRVSDDATLRELNISREGAALADPAGFPVVFTARGTLTRGSTAAGVQVVHGTASKRVCINLQGAVSIRNGTTCT